MKPENLAPAAKISKPGAYLMRSEDYFADPCPAPSLSQSVAKTLLASSPAHARIEHPKLAPPLDPDDEEETEKYSKVKVIGDAAHLTLIGRGKVLAVGDFKNWSTKEAKAFREAALAEGRIAILAKHMKIVEKVVAATRARLAGNPEYSRAFTEGHGEVCVATQEDGLWLKSLIDWSEPDWLALHDYKTSGTSAHESMVPVKLSEDEWGVQAAFQERILDALHPEGAGRRKFYFHFQENYAPFAMRSVRLAESALHLGRRKVAAAIQIWRRCLETNEWPDYPLDTLVATHTDWAERRWLDREIALEEAGLVDFSKDPVLGRVIEATPSNTLRNIMRAG